MTDMCEKSQLPGHAENSTPAEKKTKKTAEHICVHCFAKTHRGGTAFSKSDTSSTPTAAPQPPTHKHRRFQLSSWLLAL